MGALPVLHIKDLGSKASLFDNLKTQLLQVESRHQ